MPFTQEQLAYAGRHVIDFYLRNDPIDQVNTARPLWSKLVEDRREWSGGLQNVVEQLRFSNDSSFQAYFGDGQVNYNRKRTLEQAKYTWGSFHDGFGLNEDELAQNGIIVTDERNAVSSRAERVQLNNLLNENMETLKLGFQENFDLMLHRDGTQSPLEIAGLDHLVSFTPAVGVVGGINAATAPWWQNHAEDNISDADLIEEMEIAWRRCIRVGQSAPDYILVGSAYLDKYREQASQTVNRQIQLGDKSGNRRAANIDASVGEGVRTGLFFKGVELIWDPVFETLDELDDPAVDWEKRCYFLNCRHLRLRPIEGHWLVPRTPPRVYDRYVHYWALTAKAALTTNKRSAHAVLAIS